MEKNSIRTKVEDPLGPLDARRAGTGTHLECPSLSTIYAPIASDLLCLEERLDRIIDASPEGMNEQLRHVLKHGGKRIRPALTLLCGHLFSFDPDLLLPMAEAIELLHTATLLHDDTVDQSLYRRGRPTANHLWGEVNAVFLGDYLCARSASLVAGVGRRRLARGPIPSEVDHIRAIELLADTILRLCSGAIEESLNPLEVSREKYFERIGDKTACLFSAAAESGAALSSAPDSAVRSMRDFGYNLGMAFQIVDDILDCESDMKRGTLSLPAIILLEHPENRWLKELLRDNADSAIQTLIEMVRTTNVLDICYAVGGEFRNAACVSLAQAPKNIYYEALTGMAAFIMDRRV